MDRQERRHCLGSKYVPRRLAVTEDEHVIQEALKERGVWGGCWNLVMRGRAANSPDEEGFRLLEGYVAP